MKNIHKPKPIILIVLCAVMVFAFPLSAFATDELPEVTIPSSVTNIVPPPSDISENPDYGEGSTSTMQALKRLMLASSSNSVSGSCSITKESSSSVTVSGHTSCMLSDPSIGVSLMLQAYYDGSWHTVASKSKSSSGTYVSLSQGYSVSSGYYYRVKANHTLNNGTSVTSYSTSILVA